MASTKSAQWDNARLLCPPESYGAAEWREHYTAHPEILTQMLGDLFRVYKSEERKRNGTANPQGGRRRSHINGSLDELWSVITPQYATVPLKQAIRDISKISQRQLAMRMGISERSLRHLLAGTTTLERGDLERIAKVLRVHPAYFLEWRVMVVQQMVADALTSAPHLSIAALRNLRPPA